MENTLAKLTHLDSGTEHLLSPRTVVGRAPICQLQLDDPRVSGLHAELLWTGQGWALHDLGSRNGTFVDGTRLGPGQQQRLQPGAQLGFADQRFVLLADAPPPLCAVDEQGERRVATGEQLWLPSDAAPEIMVFRDLDGRWLLESSAGVQPIDGRQPVRAGARSWTLQLPERAPMTREQGEQLRLHGLRLRFFVSRDQEHVELHLQHPGGVIELPARAHNQLLLFLARARLSDGKDPNLPSSEQGWLYPDELSRMLDIDQPRLHLWCHRARKQLASEGVLDAAHLVERRVGNGQIRLGAWSLQVEQA